MREPQALPDGWHSFAFEEAFVQPRRSTLKAVPTSQYQARGRYPVVDQGKARIAGFTDDEDSVYQGPLPAIVFGDHTRELKLIADPFAPGADGTQILLPASDELDTALLYYALCATPLRNLGYARHFKLLKESRFSIPRSKTEQRKIAAILSSVDDTIEKTEAVIGQLEVVKKGLLGELLTRGMPGKHDDFVGRQVGSTREAWSTVALSDVAVKITDGEHQTPRRSTSGFLLLSARNITDDGLRLANVDYVDNEEFIRISRRCNPEPGDILISCSGSVGRVCQVPKEMKCVLVRSVALIKPDRRRILPGYLEVALRSPILQQQIAVSQKRVAQANLFQGAIRELKIPLPSVEEQNEIAQAASFFHSRSQAERASLTQLRATKTALLDALLSGRIRVSPRVEVAA